MAELTRDTLFRTPSRSESRAEITDRAAREIIQAETELRHAKTERLRAARLAHEAKVAEETAATEAARKPRTRKAARTH